jgi:hypothetical protein
MRACLAALVLAFALAGCKGSCRQLSEKLCECQPSQAAKDACLQRVSSEESRIGPTADQEATCAELLPGCDCHTIDTAEGKRACGLARALDAGS